MSDLIEELQAALGDRYHVEREIGHGGTATVFLARDLRHDRPVALKVLRPGVAALIGAERFSREIAVTAKLQHPNILTLIDSGQSSGFVYCVLPFVEGESLRSRLVRGPGALPQAEAVGLLREIVDAIRYAHRHGLVHRDIKPENVMITDGHALVLDFGIAKAMGIATDSEGQTSTGIAVGTPAYMAPEQLRADRRADHRVDIYAVGLLAHEMLTGVAPAERSVNAGVVARGAQTPGLFGAESGISSSLVSIVERCLEPDPEARFQNADDLLAAIDTLLTSPDALGGTASRSAAMSRSNNRWAVVAGMVVALLAWFAYSSSARGRHERQVREQVIPEVSRLAGALALDSAWALAELASRTLPEDPALKQFWLEYSMKVLFQTEPEGAKIFMTRYADTTHWRLLGTTPTDSIVLPGWPVRLRIVKPGFRVRELTQYTEMPLILDSEAAPHVEMVRVSGGPLTLDIPGLGHREPLQLSEFLIDRDEVTNREYQKFVDAGGYGDAQYWEQELVKDGHRVPLSEAMALFKDKSGRPGPALWEAGHAQSGMEDLPVGGVSWYEAAAYARFVGKSLPTLYHWSQAVGPFLAAWIVPGSTFSAAGPDRSSRLRGMSRFGAYDMAGNVREWCFNSTGHSRYIMGGGWSDPAYAFNIAYAQDPFNREPINGIRLAIFLRQEPALQTAMQPIERPRRDYAREQPVPDPLFETYRRLYEYDRAPLRQRTEESDSSAELWVREKVSVTAAYGGERLPIYLFLPKRSSERLQAVILFPGRDAIDSRAVHRDDFAALDFIMKSGRVLVLPVYKSTFERGDSVFGAFPDESVFYRDHMLMWAKDLRRSIDYLASRSDIDTTRIAYLGTSWGTALGGNMLAIEPRLRAAILDGAGAFMERPRPEVDQINFLPRARVPVLMLNGRFDHFFPTEPSQRPFFNLLGSPIADKRWILYEGGHFVPHDQLVAESLNWLDKYLGPVR